LDSLGEPDLKFVCLGFSKIGIDEWGNPPPRAGQRERNGTSLRQVALPTDEEAPIVVAVFVSLGIG
jgi:hypothetical protein